MFTEVLDNITLYFVIQTEVKEGMK